jgi:hypothetical protein
MLSKTANCGAPIRHNLLSFLWLATALCAVFAIVNATNDGALVVATILLIFGLQALASEALGVVVTDEGIFLPNRPVTGLPIITLWRKPILRKEFDRIDAHKENCVIIFAAGNRVIFCLFDHKSQRKFLRIISKKYPEKHISG